MISFIKGNIISAKNGIVIIENNGIGYEINVSSNTLITASNQTDEVLLFTYLNHKDDGMTLYGFSCQEEKNMFMKLISVTGVGPKAAMNILSGSHLSTLISAIVTKDLKTLMKIRGIGKKTAERIVLELKESIIKESITDADMEFLTDDSPQDSNDITDAILALRGLGIGQKEAINAVRKVTETASGIEDLIAKALKNL